MSKVLTVTTRKVMQETKSLQISGGNYESIKNKHKYPTNFRSPFPKDGKHLVRFYRSGRRYGLLCTSTWNGPPYNQFRTFRSH